MLQQYVDARLRWTGDLPGGPAPPAEPLLHEVWARAIDFAGADRSDVSAAFLGAVDDLSHAGAERALLREHSHIPGAYWVVLGMIAVLAFAAMGYHGGVAGTTRSPVMAVVAVTFSLVMALIVDIDRPGEGWINVRQDAMFEVRGLMQRTRD